MKNGKRRNQIMTELTDAEINNLTQQQFKRIDVILETVLIKSTSYKAVYRLSFKPCTFFIKKNIPFCK